MSHKFITLWLTMSLDVTAGLMNWSQKLIAQNMLVISRICLKVSLSLVSNCNANDHWPCDTRYMLLFYMTSNWLQTVDLSWQKH